MSVNPSNPLEGDALGLVRSKGQGSISSGGASQCLSAGENETYKELLVHVDFFHALSLCCTVYSSGERIFWREWNSNSIVIKLNRCYTFIVSN